MNYKDAGFLLGPALVLGGVAQGFFVSAIPVCLALMFYPINIQAALLFVYLTMMWRGLAGLLKFSTVKQNIAAKEKEAFQSALSAGHQAPRT